MTAAGVCHHCELPLPRRRAVTAAIDGTEHPFCCFGCVLAHQVARAGGEGGAAASALVRLGVAIFFAMNAMMVTLPAYVPAVYGEEAGATDGPLFQVLRVLAMVFTAPVVVLLGGPILATAGRGLRAGVANTDALIVVGTVAAYVLSVLHVIEARPEVYFDTVAMLLVLVTLGRYLEARARADAGDAVGRTLGAGPRRATKLSAADDGAGALVGIDELARGDLVRVNAGENFPGDGVVVAGNGSADQALLTGEHRPVVLGPGDPVIGGSSSIDGVFVVRLTASAADSTEGRIAAALAEARRVRTPAQQFADRVSTVMLPIVIAAALGTGVYWARVAGLDRGLLTALAVLCVACPCGLGLATPVAVWTGLQAAARRRIVVRNPAAVERLAGVGTIFFDKTGTLTERTPRLSATQVEPGTGMSEGELVRLAALIERGQAHPVARALAAVVRFDSSDPVVTDVRVIPGCGISARIGGVTTTVGSLALARRDLGLALSSVASNGTEVAVWQTGKLLGRLYFGESVRADAPAAVSALRGLGLRLRLLTGDAQAAALVPSLLQPQEVSVGLLPMEKLEQLRQSERERPGGVAMIGDGVNDGPALAGAAVGIAVDSATDLARTTADIVLMADDLRSLPWLVRHARRVTAVIRQNLAWAFGYNAIAVGLAACGLLSPLVATVAMIGSSLIVVANSRRLRR